MTLLRSILELLYFVSCIFVAVIAWFGLKQVKLLKTDILTRNKRASREKAIEAASIYATDFMKANNAVIEEFISKKLPTIYEGPIGDFTRESLSEEWLKKAGYERFKNKALLDEINHLERVAVMFTSGVADGDTGFKIIGRSFCAIVQFRYDIIAMLRNRNKTKYPYMQDIVDLYHVWSAKFTREELETARAEIDAKNSRIPSSKLDSINPDV